MGNYSPVSDTGWQPGRWWRVLDANGFLWCETSDEAEARAAMRPGDRLVRHHVRELHEWRDVQ